MEAVDQFIRMGADASLVSAVLQKQSCCINGSVRGYPFRVVFKAGKASSIMTHRDAVLVGIAEQIKSLIGIPRCEVRTYGR